MAANYYKDNSKFMILNCFYNNKEVDKIYLNNNLVYQWSWSGHVILPTLWGNDTSYEVYPPLDFPAGYYEEDYDLWHWSDGNYYPIENYINYSINEYYINNYEITQPGNVITFYDNDGWSWEVEYDEDYGYIGEEYPLENYLNILNEGINEGYINSYTITQPNNIINIFYNMDIPTTATLSEYMYYCYMHTGTVHLINSLNDMVKLDEIGEPIIYVWLNNIVNDSNNNIFVSMAIPYGNFYYLDKEREEEIVTKGGLHLDYCNNYMNYPMYFYCENSQNIYYNKNAFSFENDGYYYDNSVYLGDDDLSSGPKYDYVENHFAYSPLATHINADFNSIKDFNNLCNYTPYSHRYASLQVPLKTYSIRNMANGYNNFTNLQKSFCGKYTTILDSCYEDCVNLIGKAACGDNVISMDYAYRGCSNLSKANCGRNVKYMHAAFSGCSNLTGKAACGDNVIGMDYAYYYCSNLSYPNIGKNVKYARYTYQGCNNLRKIEVTPSLENANCMYYGVYLNVEEIVINRNDSNINIVNTLGTYGFDRPYFNVEKINIISKNNNFSTFWNNLLNNGQWNYNKAREYYPSKCFYNTINLKELYVSNGMKDMLGWFRWGLDNLNICEIPESVEVYAETFSNTNINHFVHNNNGGRYFFNTYGNCPKLTGELYIPATAEKIGGIIWNCPNVTSIKFDRNCKIPRIATQAGPNYFLNNIYYNCWPAPFLNCRNVTDIKLSNYVVEIGQGALSLGGESYSKNYNLRNVVFYNNDNLVQKNLTDAFYMASLPTYDSHYINLYVPDSNNENSFNYILYHNTSFTWTLMDNGYYNDQYKVRVLNNYDYVNDNYREV